MSNPTISPSRHVAYYTLYSVSPLLGAWTGPPRAFVAGGVDHDFATRGPIVVGTIYPRYVCAKAFFFSQQLQQQQQQQQQ